jgi:plasmid stabilization system protein ParE
MSVEVESPRSAERVRASTIEALESLNQMPNRGRPASEEDFRELVVRFGRTGYVIRYRVRDDVVDVTRIKHSREAG